MSPHSLPFVLLLLGVLLLYCHGAPTQYSGNGHYYEVIFPPGQTYESVRTSAGGGSLADTY